MSLFRKKPVAEEGHLDAPVMAPSVGEPCVICKGTKYNTEGVRAGQCTECGFSRHPVLIEANVVERVGKTDKVTRQWKLVSEDALPALRRGG